MNSAAQDIAYAKNHLRTNLDAITGAETLINAMRKKHGDAAANELATYWSTIKPKDEPLTPPPPEPWTGLL